MFKVSVVVHTIMFTIANTFCIHCHGGDHVSWAGQKFQKVAALPVV